MMTSQDNEYVCTLDEKCMQRAKEELNEDPANRIGAVETFRKWILEQPHIKCPTDTAFLLFILRTGHFSQLEARKLLERHILRRMKLAKWYKNIDPCDPKILAAIDSGSLLLLPERDDEGRKILIAKIALLDFDGKSFSKNDFFRAFACLMDYMYFMDEMTCVNGSVVFVDASNYAFKVHGQMSADDRIDYADAWKDSFPGHLKQILLYNAGTMLEVLYTILLCFNEEFQRNTKVCGEVLENVYKDIPLRCLPVEYLPDDYKGPNAGTEREIIESMKRDLTRPEVRARLQYLSSDQWKIDESLKPSNDDDATPQESFRKVIFKW